MANNSGELEKLSWYVSDGSIIMLLADQFNFIDLSGSVGISFIDIASYTELAILVGGVAAILSLFLKLQS